MLLRKLSIALALALLLAACGGSDEGDAGSAAPDTTVAGEEMTDEEMSDEEMTDEEMPTTFTVTVTNMSDSAELATPLAPGAFIVHTSMETLFADGIVDRGEGLEALAEDGDPSSLVTSLGALTTVSTSGAFANPDGGGEAGPALPGSSYSFTFEATPGDYLSFATMFVQSNDWFFAPASSGISLFEGDMPVAGDLTDLIGLWDAGTEVDEVPGEGANQAPRQAGPNTGDTQSAPIAEVDGYSGTITVSIAVG